MAWQALTQRLPSWRELPPAGSSPLFQATWSNLISPTSFQTHWRNTAKPEAWGYCLWDSNCHPRDSNSSSRWLKAAQHTQSQWGSDEQWWVRNPSNHLRWRPCWDTAGGATKGGTAVPVLGKATKVGHREELLPERPAEWRGSLPTGFRTHSGMQKKEHFEIV